MMCLVHPDGTHRGGPYKHDTSLMAVVSRCECGYVITFVSDELVERMTP